MKVRTLALAFGLAPSLFLIGVTPSRADQWTSSLTVTSAHIEDDSSKATVYVTTSQAVVNPANCSATDGYEVNDQYIEKESMAIALTAIATGLPVAFFVSSSVCVNNRPEILDFQVSTG